MVISTQKTRLDVAIAGGGIAGLASAVALARYGHNVTIYEAAKELRQVGAGIQLTPNACKLLLRWGLSPHMPDLQRGSPGFSVRNWRDGRLIGCMDTETHQLRYGGPYIQTHRADLQQALLKVAHEHDVQVCTSSRVADFDMDRNLLTLESGRIVHADLVLGADGGKSTIRQRLRGGVEDRPPRSGIAVYRATVCSEQIAKHPDLLHFVAEPGVKLWLGPRKHAVCYSMRGDSMVNIVLEYPEPVPVDQWRPETYVAHIQELFADWDPQLVALLDMVESAMKWPLDFNPPLDRWVSPSGRAALIGDAAHAVPSFLAQGAAMALEDAACLTRHLATNLALAPSASDALPAALHAYAKSRKARKAAVQDLSLRNLDLYHLDEGEAKRRRDGLADGAGAVTGLPIWRCEADQVWLYGHDEGLDES